MYLTKIIDKFGLFEDLAKDIDKECNEMLKSGYELVTYFYFDTTGKVMLTFKKC